VPAEFRDRFARQLDVVIRHTAPIHPSRLDSLKRGEQYCLVTFDDGFENFCKVALPELASRRIPALLFAIAGALGKSFGPPKTPERVMTPGQLCDLPESLVVIGSHTLTHPYLPDSREGDARNEIAQSRVVLEKLLNKTVLFFSFPFGGMTPSLVSLCRQAGYSRVFSTLPRPTSFEESDYCIGRVRVDPWDWPSEFRLKLAGAYSWLPVAISLKKLLFRNSLLAVFGHPEGTTRQSIIHNGLTDEGRARVASAEN
jgi:peptidoglycan/xylan/chitin deacetylase (PgdA/CDA1 family)